jgi:ABC-2 type transport system permease protein
MDVKTLMHDEWLKVRTARIPWVLLVIPQFIIVYATAAVVVGSGHDADRPEQIAGAAAHVGLVGVFALVLGIIGMAGQYRHRRTTDTNLSTPRRDRVFLAKIGFYAAAGLVLGLACTVTDLVTLAIALPARGQTFHLWNSNLWLTLLGSVIWDVLFGALGVAVGALIRNLYAAIIGTLVFLYLIEGALNRVATAFSYWLPWAAGESLGRVPEAGGLPPWGGGLLLTGYTALFAALAMRTIARRDVA